MLMRIARPFELLSPSNRSWHTVRSIGNSRPVQLTALAPFVGYLIVYNESISSYLSLTDIIGQEINDPSEVFWRLYLTYMGLIFLGLGSLIYSIFCPRAIKRYPNSVDFIERELQFVNRYRFENLARDYRFIDPFKYQGAESRRDIDPRHTNFDDDDKVVLLRFDYLRLNDSKILSREVCFFLFILGMILLSIPSVSTFVKISVLAFFQLVSLIGS